MNKFIASLMVLLTLNGLIMGQEKDLKGFEIVKESETINVSAERLWEIVGHGFEDAYVWATSVDHSIGSGQAKFDGATCNERSCDINSKGFNKITEKVTKYDETNMTFAYDVTEGMPGFMASARNDWTVVSVGENQSKLVMNADFRVKGFMGNMMKGMMKGKMEKLLPVILNDAKVYAETGMPSKAKMERIAKLEKKNKVAA